MTQDKIFKAFRGPQRHVKRAMSTVQRKRRNAFRTCAAYWKQSLTQDERLLWLEFSNLFETGYNAFLRINLVQVFNGLPIISVPVIYS
ncbi:hypothetical protein LCGC14_1153600 [marine sediment metagenome]|uniref:Uncharacterized protein n=1 Tax=marine sediment metagenome TaxID=412755 RepID=A0A0F9PCZ1_9ZZZZ